MTRSAIVRNRYLHLVFAGMILVISFGREVSARNLYRGIDEESADKAPAPIAQGVQLKEDRYVETQQKDAQTNETTVGDTRQKAEALIGSPCASSE